MAETRLKGKIIKSTSGLYTVRTYMDGAYREINCRARGVLRHNKILPYVGDVVRLALDSDGKTTVIADVDERRNVLIRPPIANVDYIFVTMSSGSPSPLLDVTDKLISILEYEHIEPVVVIGKCELDPETSHKCAEIYRNAGFNTFELSCATGEGVEALYRYIDGIIDNSTIAFAGASGVGKSTLINKLFDGLGLETSSVSKKTERGRHTTKSVTLFPVFGGRGYIADTPGFSMLDFEKFDFFDLNDLVYTFREFSPFVGCCKYTKCSHTKEDGCAIIDGCRGGIIAESRHESYVMLYNILKGKHKWDKKT